MAFSNYGDKDFSLYFALSHSRWDCRANCLASQWQASRIPAKDSIIAIATSAVARGRQARGIGPLVPCRLSFRPFLSAKAFCCWPLPLRRSRATASSKDAPARTHDARWRCGATYLRTRHTEILCVGSRSSGSRKSNVSPRPSRAANPFGASSLTKSC